LDLRTTNIHDGAICSNGKSVKWQTYLSRACIALGITKKHVEAIRKKSETIQELLKIAGYEGMDVEYFKNPQNVKADLEAYAKFLGPNKTPLDLWIDNCSNETICSNGKSVEWQIYLKYAGVALGLANDSKKARKRRSKILKELQKIAGYEAMDVEYFKNPQNVKADLESYAKLFGPDKTPSDLRTTNLPSEIICSNGASVKLATYLRRASIALDLAKDSREANTKKHATIQELQKIAGCEIHVSTDTEYFNNPQNVKTDLEAFARLMGPDKTPLDLSMSYIPGEITCSNGKSAKWQTYMNRACIALGFAKNVAEAISKKRVALHKLLKITGYKRMDAEYFYNSQNVKSDLEAYAKLLGPDKTPSDLRTIHLSNEIICSNGESVRWATYLNRAGIALDLAKDSREANTKKHATIQELQKIAGYTIS
jgi:hypothetical protein